MPYGGFYCALVRARSVQYGAQCRWNYIKKKPMCVMYKKMMKVPERVLAACNNCNVSGIRKRNSSVEKGGERGGGRVVFQTCTGAAPPLDAGGYVCGTSINRDPNAPTVYAASIEGSDDENAGGAGGSLRNRSGSRKCISVQWARVAVCRRAGR